MWVWSCYQILFLLSLRMFFDFLLVRNSWCPYNAVFLDYGYNDSPTGKINWLALEVEIKIVFQIVFSPRSFLTFSCMKKSLKFSNMLLLELRDIQVLPTIWYLARQQNKWPAFINVLLRFSGLLYVYEIFSY